ncbi:hypothetical protein [Tractidigestivibacter sp.]|uniref:hypothetical protein n=1 Tax=Tractidigestivibacter sp. TaxID=2847320 RepID=UPI002A90BEE2|nr:hypothetical protein [Tractidigestivibacter sp.]MDD7583842.1 hypothetical protein [Coriobacteriaceae bacterium]MDY5271164.1 hypothetical protein [Tractidigestivibacter sp.]
MASRGMRASYRQREPRKGSMPLFGNGNVTWDAFADGRELLAVTDPYEFPVFYHVGQREDGSWHVLSVEEHDYPLDPWEDQAELERQLARVRGMRLLDVGDKGFREVMDALYSYVSDESPEARAKWDAIGKEIQANVARELAEARNAKRERPEGPHVERKPRSRRLLGGLFLTFGGDR